MVDFGDNTVKRGRRAIATVEKPTNNVLMTFQVGADIREAANKKAADDAINLSQFLRGCVIQYINSKETSAAIGKLQKDIVEKALKTVA